MAPIDELAVPQITELAADIAISRMRDDEWFDLDSDVPPEPEPPAPLADRYRAMLHDGDPAARELAAEQLRRLEGYRPATAMGATEVAAPGVGAGIDLLGLIERRVGPMRRRSNGTAAGPCPWHSSHSGTCLVAWPEEGSWWCSSCRRGGGAVAWVMLVEGTSRDEARRMLGLPEEPPRTMPARSLRRRPPRCALMLPDSWRPSALAIATDWRPDRPAGTSE